MDLGLKERQPLFWAAAKGIGYAIVEAFLKEGARVAFCARKEAELKKAAEEFSALGEVYWEVVDVSQEKQVYDFAAPCGGKIRDHRRLGKQRGDHGIQRGRRVH